MSDIVRVTRTLNAGREAVFDAWTDPDQLRRWFLPFPGMIGEFSCDPVAGGRYRIVILMEEGAYEVTGEYLVVDRPGHLVFTWRSDGVAGQETKVTVTLSSTDAADRTEMTILHERIPEVRARDALHTGWVAVADILGRFVSSGK